MTVVFSEIQHNYRVLDKSGLVIFVWRLLELITVMSSFSKETKAFYEVNFSSNFIGVCFVADNKLNEPELTCVEEKRPAICIYRNFLL